MPDPTSPEHINFWKLEGCGNSFVVTIDTPVLAREGLAFDILHPNRGVGSDGLMIVGQAISNRFPVRMYNADGSKAGMCGNGIRCVTRFLILEGLLAEGSGNVDFSVWGREISCSYDNSGKTVEVDMGAPSFDPDDIPVLSDEPMIATKFEVNNLELSGTALSMGNPHFVVKLDSEMDISQLGPALSDHGMFPDRANIEFVRVLSPELLAVQVCERGVGFTLACGTGACAAVVAGVREGWCGPTATVLLPGGELKVRYDQENDRVFLKGPAREIFHGKMTI